MSDHHDSGHTESREERHKKHRLHEIFRELGLDLGVFGSFELLRKVGIHGLLEMIRGFFGKAGQKVGEKTVERLGFMVFGPDKEDERRYNAALLSLPENDRILLSKRLSVLTSLQSDYYRLTVMQNVCKDDAGLVLDYDKSVQATAAILLMHARMSQEEWDRHCVIMNYKMQQDLGHFKEFWAWLKTDGAKWMEKETERLQEELVRQKAALRRPFSIQRWWAENRAKKAAETFRAERKRRTAGL